MIKAKIKIKNYRCFSDKPQEIEIGPGFTALVGLNNSGKSTILKMFYELRPLWAHLSHPNNLTLIVKNHYNEIGTQGLSDVAEIFHNNNKRPIEISFILYNEKDERYEFSFKITEKIGGAKTLDVFGLGLKINDKDVELINSIHANDESTSIVFIETLANNQQKNSYLKVDFLADFFRELKESIYIPSFRNIINVGENKQHYDIATGTAFIKQWDEWKTGSRKFEKQQIIKITNDIRDLFEYQSFEINASSDKSSLWLLINNNSYSMLEVGSGLSQFILTFATAAIKKPTLIFIDEPELSLHPALQLKFLTNLGTYASTGIVFATHSLGLARSAEKVFSVTSDGKESKIKPFTNTPDYATLLGELSFSAYKEIGAECIFFVEGVTEVRTMQELLRKYNKDNKILVISLGGNDMINGKREMELSEITNRVSVNKVYAWIDSEKESHDADLKVDRKNFSEVCKRLNICLGISQRRAIENYFTPRAILMTFNDEKKMALDLYEKPDPSSNWSKEENWKIARELNFDEIKDTDIGKFIENINC